MPSTQALPPTERDLHDTSGDGTACDCGVQRVHSADHYECDPDLDAEALVTLAALLADPQTTNPETP